MKRALLLLTCLLASSLAAPGLGHAPYVAQYPEPGSFRLADSRQIASICLDAAEDPGVRHAADNLRDDIQRVIGRAPDPLQSEVKAGTNPVLIGTLGHSDRVD